MTTIRTLVIGLVLLIALAGCPTEEEENFAAEMCEVMADGATEDLTAGVDVASAPELAITEGHEDGHVNVVAGLSDADATFVAFTPDEDGELVLLADTADAVTGLYEDGTEVTLGAGSPNDECGADIPEHWHIEDLTGGTTFTLALGPAAVSEVQLVIAHTEGDHDHD